MREMRETSIITYHQIISEGLLGKRQVIVYEALKSICDEFGDATDYEIAKSLERPDPNFVRPRRKELVDYGLVEEVQHRKCCVTGRLAIAWRVKTKTRINENLRKKLLRKQKTLEEWVD